LQSPIFLCYLPSTVFFTPFIIENANSNLVRLGEQ
jgi:hypothetical protein